MRLLLATFLALLPCAAPGLWLPVHPSILSPQIPLAPILQNQNMECSQGFDPQPDINGMVPRGWHARVLNGSPTINSAHLYFRGRCDPNDWVEHLEGQDSLAFVSQDIETPPVPGKPFDAVVYQQVAVTPGKTYSVSGWMVSFCGGSNNNPPLHPNDCPAGYYIDKMLGVDPAGGADPNAAGVLWTHDQRNFTEARWVNLRLPATAQSDHITIFLRINSPFQHHGAHALVDGIAIAEAPSGRVVNLPARAGAAWSPLQWEGSLSADIRAIPPGLYTLYFNVQYRAGTDGPWVDLAQRTGQTSQAFDGCAATPGIPYHFRVQPLGEQPDGVNGAWPNQRYPGNWATDGPVTFDVAAVTEAEAQSGTATAIPIFSAADAALCAGTPLTVGAAGHGAIGVQGGRIIYTSAPGFSGADVLTYTLGSGAVQRNLTLSLHVTPANHAPELYAGPQMNAPGDSVWLPLAAHDPEGDPVSFSAEGLPPGLSLDAHQAGVIQGVVAADAAGDYAVTLRAGDGALTSTVTLDWQIIEKVWRTYGPVVAKN